jgi:hypothetical protein
VRVSSTIHDPATERTLGGGAEPLSPPLTALRDRAAAIDPDDPSWPGLVTEAVTITSALAHRDRLPAHLVVSGDEPPVVVARLVAAAWRHVSRPTSALPGGAASRGPVSLASTEAAEARWASSTTAVG